MSEPERVTTILVVDDREENRTVIRYLFEGSEYRVLEAIDFGALPAEIGERLRPVAEQRAITLSVNIAVGLPLVQADAGRLEQVLTNLLSNALKLTKGPWCDRPRRHSGGARGQGDSR